MRQLPGGRRLHDLRESDRGIDQPQQRDRLRRAALNVPTFRRQFTSSATTTGTGSPTDHLTFTQVGTSMSAAIVTGSYALVSSALNYWINLATSNGYTADAYLEHAGRHRLAELRQTRVQEPLGLEQSQRHQRDPSLDCRAGPRCQRRRQRVDATHPARRHDIPVVCNCQRGQRRRRGRGLRRDQLPLHTQRLEVYRHRSRRHHHRAGDADLRRQRQRDGVAGSRCHGGAPGRHRDLQRRSTPGSTTRSSTRTRTIRPPNSADSTSSITRQMASSTARSRSTSTKCSPASCCRRLMPTTSPTASEPQPTASCSRRPRATSSPCRHAAEIPMGIGVGGQEVPQHLAGAVQGRKGPTAWNDVPALHAL